MSSDLERLRNLLAKTEKNIKIIEAVNGNFALAVLNEWRYSSGWEGLCPVGFARPYSSREKRSQPRDTRGAAFLARRISHRADICHNTRMSVKHTQSAGVRRIKAVIGNLG